MTFFIQTNSKFNKILEEISVHKLMKNEKFIKTTDFTDLENINYSPDVIITPYDSFSSKKNTLNKAKYQNSIKLFFSGSFTDEDILKITNEKWDILKIKQIPTNQLYISNIIKILLNKIERQANTYNNIEEPENRDNSFYAEELPSPIIVTTLPENEIIFINETAAKSLEYTIEECLKMNLRVILHDAEEFNNLLMICRENSVHTFEIQFKKKSGTPLNAIIYLKKAKKKNQKTLLLTITDITDRKEAEKNLKEFNFILEESIEKSSMLLQRQAVKDAFTGLPNRGKFIHDIQNDELKTIFILNIDSFSSINSAYGMNAGNAVLMQVASLLNEQHENSEQVYRIGSDEFAIFPLKKIDDVEKYAQTLIDHILQEPAEYQEVEIPISVSIGILHNEKDSVIKKANIALSEARKKGIGKYAIYKENKELIKKFRNNIKWARKITKAVRNNEIVPFYQGIRDNITGKINKYECLIRIISDGIIILPGSFLESAAQTGVLASFSRVMIEKSFIYMKNKPFDFSINLSSDDFYNNGTLNFIEEQLSKQNIDPSRVTFEVLESFSYNNAENALVLLNKIHELGCKIAIDDFGKDYSNFSRLLDIKVDYLKIDGSFVNNMDKNQNSYTIVKAMTDFAHSIGCEVVAEYVDSEAIQAKVFKLGIEYSQGFLFSKPFNDEISIPH